MNKKKNQVQINYIFTNLILKNKIVLLFFLLFSVLISYLYNNHHKTISFNYSIQIEASEVWISENAAIEEIVGPKNFYRVLVGQYLRSLPSNTSNKYYTKSKDGRILVSFSSMGQEKVDVSNFLDYLNNHSSKALYKKLNTAYNNTIRISNIQNEFNFNESVKELEVLKLMYNFQKSQEVTRTKLNELKYYIDNYDELFSDDIYYTLNGWVITNNRMTNEEILFSGLFFGSLISSFFLFFKSNYFRKKVLN